MAARIVMAKVAKHAGGYEATAEHSGISVNGHASEGEAVRALAIALNFPPGRYTTRFRRDAGDGTGSDWSIEGTR